MDAAPGTRPGIVVLLAAYTETPKASIDDVVSIADTTGLIGAERGD
jgi:hypothetical protein